jgi:hypothetical protein
MKDATLPSLQFRPRYFLLTPQPTANFGQASLLSSFSAALFRISNFSQRVMRHWASYMLFDICFAYIDAYLFRHWDRWVFIFAADYLAISHISLIFSFISRLIRSFRCYWLMRLIKRIDADNDWQLLSHYLVFNICVLIHFEYASTAITTATFIIFDFRFAVWEHCGELFHFLPRHHWWCAGAAIMRALILDGFRYYQLL